MNAEPLSVSEPTPPHRYSMEGRRNATPKTSRFKAVFAALADVGVDAKPVVYEDDVLDATRPGRGFRIASYG